MCAHASCSGRTRLESSDAVHELVCDLCGLVLKQLGRTPREEPLVYAAGGPVQQPPRAASAGCVPGP